jgi:hypothetical protein
MNGLKGNNFSVIGTKKASPLRSFFCTIKWSSYRTNKAATFSFLLSMLIKKN